MEGRTCDGNAWAEAAIWLEKATAGETQRKEPMREVPGKSDKEKQESVRESAVCRATRIFAHGAILPREND